TTDRRQRQMCIRDSFAVGGVTPENLAQWIDAGCAGAGLGSDLYRAGQSVERTAQQAAAFVKAYREAVQ
ncbi:hypothetical protein LMT12_25995, partial [Escherichia coli]|nr:hypothetical protein [Escherichia coli]